jgi:hypothetical protein
VVNSKDNQSPSAIRVHPDNVDNIIDYNNLYSYNSNLVGNNSSSSAGEQLTLSEWQSATGFDLNSISCDPKFMDSLLHIPANSPLCGRGIYLSESPVDFYGNPRGNPPTIGAYELTNCEPCINLPSDTVYVCEGENAVLEVSGECGWHWVNEQGDTLLENESLVLNPVSSANYYLRTCAKEYPIRIEFQPLPSSFSLGADSLLCEGDSLLLEEPLDTAYIFQWQNGSDAPSYWVSESGVYWLEKTNSCGAYRDSIVVGYHPNQEVFLGEDTLLCDLEEGYVLDAGEGYVSYHWQNGQSTQEQIINQSGQYWVEVEDVNGCVWTDSISIHVDNSPEAFTLGNDTLLCEGNELYLQAPQNQDYDYQWQDDSSEYDYVVEQGGLYWVEVSNRCGVYSDSIIVGYFERHEVNLGSDTTMCQGDELVLDAGEYEFYLWQDGSQNQHYLVTEGGEYWVEVEDGNGCLWGDTIQVAYEICLGTGNNLASLIRIYPNPVSEFVTVEIQSGYLGEIYVRDVFGRLLHAELVSSTITTLDFSRYSKGVYLIEIEIEGGRLVGKVVKP